VASSAISNTPDIATTTVSRKVQPVLSVDSIATSPISIGTTVLVSGRGFEGKQFEGTLRSNTDQGSIGMIRTENNQSLSFVMPGTVCQVAVDMSGVCPVVLEIIPGEYTLSIALSGSTTIKELPLVIGPSSSLTVPRAVSVSVVDSTVGNDVFIEGASVSITKKVEGSIVGEKISARVPVIFENIMPGLYSVIVSKEGFTTRETDLEVSVNKANTVTVPLSVDKNLITHKDWGVSFTKDDTWVLGEKTGSYFVLRSSAQGKVTDTIVVSYITGNSITDRDPKSSKYVLYYWDAKNGGGWYEAGNDGTSQDYMPRIARPALVVFGGTPVFVGASGWQTYIVPLSQSTFIKMSIDGSGQTEPLNQLLQTMHKL
jgi:hypothetical protein